MEKVYIIEAESASDHDINRYRVDKEVLDFFKIDSLGKAPDRVLQALLDNKDDWHKFLGVDTYHAKTTDDIQKVLQKWLDTTGSRGIFKARLLEHGVVPLDDVYGLSGIGEHVGGYSSKSFHDWLNKNNYQVADVYEILIG